MKKPVLLIIDVQQGFENHKWGKRNNPEAENNIARLLKVWRERGNPVIHVQHASTNPASPLHPSKDGFEIMEIVRPNENEPVFIKNVNSAFIGTDLEKYLRKNGYDTLVIAGLTTNHCVSTTTRMAGNLGFKTYIVSDATAAFGCTDHTGRHFSADEIHAVSLANLHEEFAEVTHTEEVLGNTDPLNPE